MIKLNDLAIGYNGEAILEHIDQEFDEGGDYGMGNAFETYPLAVMTHLADMEATYLVEGLATK